MACEEAQELHCFGAEPAADLDADHRVDSAARSRVPGKSRSACAVQRPPPRIPVARRRAGGLGRVWRGGKRWWRQVQAVSRAKGEAIGEDLDAPLIGDRNVQVHVREPDGACHSGASFMAYRATECSRGQRASGQNARGGTGRAVVTEGSSTPRQLHLRGASGRGRRQAPQQQDPELTCAHRMHGQPNAASPGTATSRQLGLVQGARRPRSI